MELKQCDVIRLTGFKTVSDDGGVAVEFRANEPKTKKKDKKVFVCLLMGVEPMVCDPNSVHAVDPVAVLESHGWKPPKELRSKKSACKKSK